MNRTVESSPHPATKVRCRVCHAAAGARCVSLRHPFGVTLDEVHGARRDEWILLGRPMGTAAAIHVAGADPGQRRLVL